MRTMRDRHLRARLDLGQGKAVDRGGTPNLPGVMDAICHFFIGNIYCSEHKFMDVNVLSYNFAIIVIWLLMINLNIV